LAAGVWNDLRSLAEGRKVAVDFQPLPPACGDPALLRQVLVNLLSNALKFTARSGEARISVGGGTEAGHTVYCVRDNGIGFDMADAGKLFGVFSRLNAADEFEGAGVGLALVQRIVQRHGGRVWAEGRSGAGAAFYFSLPQAAPAVHNGGGPSVSVPA
jgi:signal transduction histidine kinase